MKRLKEKIQMECDIAKFFNKADQDKDYDIYQKNKRRLAEGMNISECEEF